MKKITDERLIMQNLKNIRIAFLVQSLGIIGILFYTFIKQGMEAMRNNPLWMLFMITGTLLAYLQMNISVEHENPDKKLKKGSYTKMVLIVAAISIILGFLVTISPGSGLKDGIIIGIVIFVCMLASYSYTYYLRKKRSKDLDDDE